MIMFRVHLFLLNSSNVFTTKRKYNQNRKQISTSHLGRSAMRRKKWQDYVIQISHPESQVLEFGPDENYA